MNLLWIDIETNGLDPATGKILEIAAVATTPDLDTVDVDTFLIDPVDLAKTFERANEYVQKMHTENGLWTALATEPLVSLVAVPGRLIDFATRTECIAQDGRSPLCGSSVHFDRAWLKHHASKFVDAMSYRNVDVSTLDEIAKAWFDASHQPPKQEKPHRAIDDILASIERLSWYKRHIFAPYSRLVRQGPLT